MIGRALSKLLEYADDALGQPVDAEISALQLGLARDHPLVCLLSACNGFYAFSNALLVRPLACLQPPLGVVQWNELGLWKAYYATSIEMLCFAEDVFGMQYGLRNDAVVMLDAETGAVSTVGASLEQWALEVLTDTDFRTGYSLAGAWQRMHGTLRRGQRLRPSLPFVLGGKFAVEDLNTIDDVEAMRFMADIANQIADVPDGGTVILRKGARPSGS